MTLNTFAILNITTLAFTPTLHAQKVSVLNHKKIQIVGLVHSGVSIFNVTNVPKTPLYGTYEMHLGSDFVKPLNELMKVSLGINFGLKAKRKSYYYGPSGSYTQKPAAIPSLDRAASGNIHLVTELRATAQIQPRAVKTALKIGLAARFWNPNNDDVDILTARNEFGIISGFNYQTIQRLGMGIEWYASLKDFYNGTIGGAGGSTTFNVKNQYFMLTAEYRLN